jgi:hypothetical protein
MIATQGHQDQSIRIHKYVLLPQFCLPSQHKKIDKNLILLHFFFHQKVTTEIVPDDVVLRHLRRGCHEVR